MGRATTALSYDRTVVIDGRTLHAEGELEADVCVVGAGPSGIALTGELLNSDLRVCVLENGGTGETWRTQFLLGGESVGHPYPRLVISAVSAFGGSSHRWGPYWHARPLDAIDSRHARGSLIPAGRSDATTSRRTTSGRSGTSV